MKPFRERSSNLFRRGTHLAGPYVPRQYLSSTAKLTSFKELGAIYNRLKRRLKKAQSVPKLEQWLKDYGEVDNAVNQLRNLRQIAHLMQTDDRNRRRAADYFTNKIDPWLRPREMGLFQLLDKNKAFRKLPSYYNVHRKDIQEVVRAYHPKNTRLAMEEQKLMEQYEKIFASTTIFFEGKPRTLQWMEKVSLDPKNRERRQRAFEAKTKTRLEQKEQIENLFDELLKIRHQIARNAGFKNYRSYISSLNGDAYTPKDCLSLDSAIAEHVVPLFRERQRRRQEMLGIDSLRPWDLAVNPEGLSPLEPFKTSMELVQKAGAVLKKIDPRFKKMLDNLIESGLYDLENRRGKSGSCFEMDLPESRQPFLSTKPVGTQRDLEEFIHEATHGFHTVAAREQRLADYRDGIPMEFCEMAAMGMELLTVSRMEGVIYPRAEARRALRDHLDGVVEIFCTHAQIDHFENWLYTHPRQSLNHKAREKAWLESERKFSGIEDWNGYEKARTCAWHPLSHIFDSPFYAINYPIAQMGTIPLWAAAEKDQAKTVDRFWNALQLGGSRTLCQLWAAAGLRFDISGKTLKPVVEKISQKIDELEKGISRDKIEFPTGKTVQRSQPQLSRAGSTRTVSWKPTRPRLVAQSK